MKCSYTQYFRRIADRLSGDLPGKTAQYKMAPTDRPGMGIHPDRKTRYAGVLILLYPKNQEYYTILIRRTLYYGVHSGQISLPGGKQEPGDQNLISTALRETEEEIGINSKNIEVIGKLTPLYIPVSNYYVQPVIGALNSEPSFRKDYKEVEEIFSIRLSDLMDPECIIEGEHIHERERKIKAPYYCYNNLKIWGATAMILSEFIELHKKLCTNPLR